MTKKERYKAFIDYFIANVPDAETELKYSSPYELLVAVMLSAQCTDVRVNMVTPALFEAFPDVESLSRASFDTVFPFIQSISYPNNKTKYLLSTSKILIDEHNGKVPDTVDDLVKLPGVGRKTANVITSVLYQQPNMAVDTHVFRVSKRLGLVSKKATTPLSVEKELVKHIPSEYIHIAHHWLILHGRYICLARKPKCDICDIKHICKYY